MDYKTDIERETELNRSMRTLAHRLGLPFTVWFKGVVGLFARDIYKQGAFEWRKKWEELEMNRALCCSRMEKALRQARSVLSCPCSGPNEWCEISQVIAEIDDALKDDHAPQ